MAYSIRCPVCREKFPWIPTDGFPEECPNTGCKSRIAHDRADDDIVLPFIRSSAKTKAVDGMYRQMEEGSEFRAQAAAAELGVPASEMSSLKITNMQDNLRPGDMAAKEVTAANNTVVRHMEATGVGGFQQNGAGFASGTSTGAINVNGKIVQGIEPRAGARTMSRIQRLSGKM